MPRSAFTPFVFAIALTVACSSAHRAGGVGDAARDAASPFDAGASDAHVSTDDGGAMDSGETGDASAGDDGGPTLDADVRDANAAMDAGGGDAGPSDGGASADAAGDDAMVAPDGGTPDAGTTDGRAPDAGTTDGRAPDAGTTDAALGDAGTDAGTDAGPTNACEAVGGICLGYGASCTDGGGTRLPAGDSGCLFSDGPGICCAPPAPSPTGDTCEERGGLCAPIAGCNFVEGHFGPENSACDYASLQICCLPPSACPPEDVQCCDPSGPTGYRLECDRGTFTCTDFGGATLVPADTCGT